MKRIDMSLVNKMWGGVVDDYHFSISKHRLELKIKVEHIQVMSWFSVALMDISFFEFKDENHYEWDYIELSDVYVDRHGEEQLKVQFVFWLEAAILTVICGDMDIRQLPDEILGTQNVEDGEK